MATLNHCQNELQSIINELRDIEWGIRYDRTATANINIGETFYADCLDIVAYKCERSMKRLNNVNTNKLADWVLGEN